MRFSLTVLVALVGYVAAQQQQYTTPVPILKQINRHNEDGSYSFGYEAADGSFKIETKHPNGEVYGKYGYIDDAGKVREVEYGATKRGFEPQGTGINVPPPTVDVQSNTINSGAEDYDDGSYREDPTIYHKDPRYNNGVSYKTAPVQTKYSAPAYTHQQPAYNPPQPRYQPTPAPVRYNAPAYNPPAYNPPAYQYHPAQFASHPAVQNIDYLTGSYSINYSGKK